MPTFIKRKGTNGPVVALTVALQARLDAGDFEIVPEAEVNAQAEKRAEKKAPGTGRFLRRKGTSGPMFSWTAALAAKPDFEECAATIEKAAPVVQKEKEPEAPASPKAPEVPKVQVPDAPAAPIIVDPPAPPEPDEESKKRAAANKKESILAIIRMMNPETDYTKPTAQKAACPKIDILKEMSGFEVTGAERDEAFADYLEEQADLASGVDTTTVGAE